MNDAKSWFITGCDSGMGYSVAEALLERGDVVVMTALNKNNLEPLLKAYPKSSFGLTLDVTDRAMIPGVVSEAERLTGGIDVVYNNAGYGLLGAVEESQFNEYYSVFNVDFFGLVEVTKAFLPFMRARKSGCIINTSSLAGYSAGPGAALYAAAKFAVEGFTQGLRAEVSTFGIQVMTIEPGSFRTNFAGSSMKRAAATIDAYSTTAVASTLERMEKRHGTQPNDPAKIGPLLFELSRRNDLPLRLPLGSDALARVQATATAALEEFDAWEATANKMGFE